MTSSFKEVIDIICVEITFHFNCQVAFFEAAINFRHDGHIELREYLDVVNSEGAKNHTERQEMNVADEDSASDAFVLPYLWQLSSEVDLFLFHV